MGGHCSHHRKNGNRLRGCDDCEAPHLSDRLLSWLVGSQNIRLDEDILDYFNRMAKKTGIPYQTLINMCLRKFANEESKLVIQLDDKKTG